MKRTNRSTSRGFSTLEALIAMLLVAALFSVTVLGFHSVVRIFARTTSAQLAHAELNGLADRWIAEAQTADAIYTVSACGPARCDEVRFMAFDPARRARFWGYRMGAGGVQRCSFTSAEGPCTRAARPISALTFGATPVAASALDLPAARGYRTADRIYDLLGAVDDPHHRVVGGNRLMELAVANEYGGRKIVLLPGGEPFDAAVVVGFVTPPPSVPTPTASSGPDPCPPGQPGCRTDRVYLGGKYSAFYCWGAPYVSPHGGVMQLPVDLQWPVYYFSSDGGRSWNGFATDPVVTGKCVTAPPPRSRNLRRWWTLPFAGSFAKTPPVTGAQTNSTTILAAPSGGPGFKTIVLSDGFGIEGSYVLFPGDVAAVSVSASAGTSMVASVDPTTTCDGYLSIAPALDRTEAGAFAAYAIAALKPMDGTSRVGQAAFPTCRVAWAADANTGLPPQATFIDFSVVPTGTTLR